MRVWRTIKILYGIWNIIPTLATFGKGGRATVIAVPIPKIAKGAADSIRIDIVPRYGFFVFSEVISWDSLRCACRSLPQMRVVMMRWRKTEMKMLAMSSRRSRWVGSVRRTAIDFAPMTMLVIRSRIGGTETHLLWNHTV